MEQSFIPVRVDKSHLTSIGVRLYTQGLDLIRELVANAYDADATEVKIMLNGHDLIVEDNGEGMNRQGLEQYFTIGSTFKKHHPMSPRFKRARIGEFGIGKFAVLSLCDRFELYTRSVSYAATVIFDKADFEASKEWSVPVIEHEMKPNSRSTCTKVTLNELKKTLLPSDIERHLRLVFPLNEKSFSISIDGTPLQPAVVAGRRFKIKETTDHGRVTGELVLSSLHLPKEMLGIGIRVKGILVKRDYFQLDRRHSGVVGRLTGEVNADFLPITTSRSDFVSDSKEYQSFYALMQRKLRAVIKVVEKASLSYADKKAERTLSDALAMIRSALKKNNDIFLPGEMPLFTASRSTQAPSEYLGDSIVGKAMTAKKPLDRELGAQREIKSILSEAVKALRPKVRKPVKTVLKDDRRVVKKIKIGGAEFLVSFARLGKEERESFSEGGIIFINREHPLFKKVEKKSELVFYHLIRLVSQELTKLASPRGLDVAYDWQGRLISDAFLKIGKQGD